MKSNNDSLSPFSAIGSYHKGIATAPSTLRHFVPPPLGKGGKGLRNDD